MATRAESNLVYASGTVQGIALVTFPAASSIFTDPAAYDLSTSQYGVMFVPQVVTAIAASILGADHGIAAFGAGSLQSAGVSQPDVYGIAAGAAVVLGVLSFVVVKQRAAPGPLASQTRGAGSITQT